VNEIVITKRRFCLNFEGNKVRDIGNPLNMIANNPNNNLKNVIIFYRP
jgi:hypothetical protein